MKILITGICGFVGSTLAGSLAEDARDLTIYGIDNLSRPGSELNRAKLQARGVRVFHGDIRNGSDFSVIPAVDWVIDAAANPSVLAGIDGQTGSLQLIEHNLFGTVNVLEFCKTHGAGCILLSTSRVYSIKALSDLELGICGRSFCLKKGAKFPPGLTPRGIGETFSTAPPVSLYGSAKLASETLALEYGETFDFPVWINRCGVLAGAGQFGRQDQGIIAYWINGYLRRIPLSYRGFGGNGYQVRDVLHPRDLAPLLRKQMSAGLHGAHAKVINLGGGITNAI
ncbi:MAG: CDP-tyvelose epimerase, partial [Treponema sp. GWB1_62_6]